MSNQIAARAGAVLALALTVLAPATPAGAAGERLELPLHVRNVAGTARLWVSIRINGSEPIDAAVDTGSVGLIVLGRVVPGADDLARGQGGSVAFAGGETLDGFHTRADFAFGDAPAADVPFLVIEKASCQAHSTDCHSDQMAFESFRLMADGGPGTGFDALLGLGMGTQKGGSVLDAMGVERWIVVSPRKSWDDVGSLILNPTDEEVAAFKRLPARSAFVGPQGTLDGAVDGCLVLRDTGKRICMPLSPDTGAAGFVFETDDMWLYDQARAAGKYRFEFGGEGDTVGFDIDAPPIAFKHEPPQPGSPRQILFAGIRPYYFFEILYDRRENAVGFKARD